MNGRIFDINTTITPAPPVHENCKCVVKILNAIIAGFATKNGLNGADWWLAYHNKLPNYYLTKANAKAVGWKDWKGNLSKVTLGKMIGGDIYYNREGKLPQSPGRIWYEADINYENGYRNTERILYSSDGIIFATYDHYSTFFEIVLE